MEGELVAYVGLLRLQPWEGLPVCGRWRGHAQQIQCCRGGDYVHFHLRCLFGLLVPRVRVHCGLYLVYWQLVSLLPCFYARVLWAAERQTRVALYVSQPKVMAELLVVLVLAELLALLVVDPPVP